MDKIIKRHFVKCSVICLAIVVLYGAGRLYEFLTHGFTIENILSDFSYHPEWETRPLSPSEQNIVANALQQTYTYLNKGRQVYVFQSKDGQYVIKFFKYQRFRLKSWENIFLSLPFLKNYRQEKIDKKQQRLDSFLLSWVVAFNDLQEETGLVYVHLNKTDYLKTKLLIVDKIGHSTYLDLDQMEFCIQKKAEMLSSVFLRFKKQSDFFATKQLISRLFDLLIGDYQRGFVDNDPALMKNMGVIDGYPIYIDIGQLVKNERIKNPETYFSILALKMQELEQWFVKHYPEAVSLLKEVSDEHN